MTDEEDLDAIKSLEMTEEDKDVLLLSADKLILNASIIVSHFLNIYKSGEIDLSNYEVGLLTDWVKISKQHSGQVEKTVQKPTVH